MKISDHYIADVAESADALASGASPRKGVWVQVPSSAPQTDTNFKKIIVGVFFLNILQEIKNISSTKYERISIKIRLDAL